VKRLTLFQNSVLGGEIGTAVTVTPFWGLTLPLLADQIRPIKARFMFVRFFLLSAPLVQLRFSIWPSTFMGLLGRR